MAIAYVKDAGLKTASGFSGTTNGSFASLPVVGNHVIVGLSLYDGASVGMDTCTDNQSNSYQEDHDYFGGAGGFGGSAGMYSTKVATSTGTFTITLDPSNASNNFIAWTAVEFSGIDTGTWLDKSGQNNSATGDASVTASGANTTSNGVAIGVAFVNNTDTDINIGDTPPSGYTNIQVNEDAQNIIGFSMVYKIYSASETSSASWSHDNTSQTGWRAVIATYKAAAAGSSSVSPSVSPSLSPSSSVSSSVSPSLSPSSSVSPSLSPSASLSPSSSVSRSVSPSLSPSSSVSPSLSPSSSVSSSVSPSLSPSSSVSPSNSPSLSPSSSVSPSLSPSSSVSVSVSPSLSPSSSVSSSPSPSNPTLTEGSTTWGHDTGVVETNIRDYTGNWSGTGSISGSGDAEKMTLSAGQYMNSEVVITGTVFVKLETGKYQAGDSVTIKYRHGDSEAACLAASFQTYSSPFDSLGYVQMRLEA